MLNPETCRLRDTNAEELKTSKQLIEQSNEQITSLEFLIEDFRKQV
jgi:hypothetical protein